MGACFSTWMIIHSNHHLNLSPSSANVITIDGQLRQFPIPITVSQILRQIQSESESQFFVCNSDSLYYDEHVPAMDATEELFSGQIYFILPNSKLNYTLSSSDMAALAVKASVAISSINTNSKRSNSSKSQISPITLSTVSEGEAITNRKKSYNSDKQAGGGLGISKSGTATKLQRYSTRRAKLAARSFRRLTTIYEISDL